MIENFLPSYSKFFCFESNDFGFPELSTSVWKLAKTENELHGYWWLHQENQGLASFQNIWFC